MHAAERIECVGREDLVVDATKPYNKVRIMIQFTKKAGTAWFDNFVLSQD